MRRSAKLRRGRCCTIETTSRKSISGVMLCPASASSSYQVPLRPAARRAGCVSTCARATPVASGTPCVAGTTSASCFALTKRGGRSDARGDGGHRRLVDPGRSQFFTRRSGSRGTDRDRPAPNLLPATACGSPKDPRRRSAPVPRATSGPAQAAGRGAAKRPGSAATSAARCAPDGAAGHEDARRIEAPLVARRRRTEADRAVEVGHGRREQRSSTFRRRPYRPRGSRSTPPTTPSSATQRVDDQPGTLARLPPEKPPGSRRRRRARGRKASARRCTSSSCSGKGPYATASARGVQQREAGDRGWFTAVTTAVASATTTHASAHHTPTRTRRAPAELSPRQRASASAQMACWPTVHRRFPRDWTRYSAEHGNSSVTEPPSPNARV